MVRVCVTGAEGPGFKHSLCTRFFKNSLCLPSKWAPGSLQSWGRWRRWGRGVAPHFSYTLPEQAGSLRATSPTAFTFDPALKAGDSWAHQLLFIELCFSLSLTPKANVWYFVHLITVIFYSQKLVCSFMVHSVGDNFWAHTDSCFSPVCFSPVWGCVLTAAASHLYGVAYWQQLLLTCMGLRIDGRLMLASIHCWPWFWLLLNTVCVFFVTVSFSSTFSCKWDICTISYPLPLNCVWWPELTEGCAWYSPAYRDWQSGITGWLDHFAQDQ